MSRTATEWVGTGHSQSGAGQGVRRFPEGPSRDGVGGLTGGSAIDGNPTGRR